MVEKLTLSDKEWKDRLTPEQFKVLRKGGTERAFTGPHWDTKAPGVYCCAGCGLPLFDAATKYDSGTGWPSFYAPVQDDHVTLKDDRSFFMRRTEVLCARCDGHLGHVFDDGPPPTGKRYCMNGFAMTFKPQDGAEADGAGMSDGEGNAGGNAGGDAGGEG